MNETHADPPVFLDKLSKIFSLRVRQYGPSPAGVLWKGRDGQQLRFEVLCNIMNDAPPASKITINDLGCGYGAFFDFLHALPQMPEFDYAGYDISSEMVAQAQGRIKDHRAHFHVADCPGRTADYTFVSGTYNLHVDVDTGVWSEFIKESLSQLWARSDRGLAFNMLDKHHPNHLAGLYYADRDEFMEFCTRFSADVTLIDDYPLDEWTIFIRR